MAKSGRSTQADHRRHLALAAALVTLVSGLGAFGEASRLEGLWIAASVILILGASAVVWWTVRDELAGRRKQREEIFRRLRTTRPGREYVPVVEELTAYELGADEVALDGADDDDGAEYLPRDRDDDLQEALALARQAPDPRMVVLRGPSKSGKSRTLYEAVRSDPVLSHAAVLAPRDVRAFAAILDDGAPAPSRGQLVLWLDDLESFVSAGHAGMDRDALSRLAGWNQPIVVVATAGGKGADQYADGGLSIPIRQLYSHRKVTYVSLRSELSPTEQGHVRKRFPPEAAQKVLTYGIGEYLVAAQELARKLDDERHKPDDDECPEGAAVAWAAIDWARAGMTESITGERLRAIWPLYLHGVQPTDDRFEDGLEWALRPVYRSAALVNETNSYEAYDWIVAHADKSSEREINIEALERIIREVDPEAAFDLGIAAYGKGAKDHSRRAFERGGESADEHVAATSYFNLGYLLAEQGDLHGARGAYEQAMERSEADSAAMAALNLGILLEQHDEADAAAVAYDRAIALRVAGHSAMAALNLGVMRSKQGDIDGARAALEQAAEAQDSKLACRAAFLLGHLLLERGAPGAAAAFERALESDDPEIAPAAAYLLGGLLEAPDPAGARAAYKRVAASDNRGLVTLAEHRLQELAGQPANRMPDRVAQARFHLALKLDEEGDVDGAQAAYQAVIDSGQHDLAAASAFSLAVLLGKQDDPRGARTAYEQAIESGDARIVPGATYGLGELLVRQGELPAARDLLEQAAMAEDPDIAAAARTMLEGLP